MRQVHRPSLPLSHSLNMKIGKTLSRKPHVAVITVVALVLVIVIASLSTIASNPTSQLFQTIQQLQQQHQQCSASKKDTRGLICVHNALWGAILKEDSSKWRSIQKARETTKWTRLPEYRQSIWVPTLSCPFEQRIGELGDGGKWICEGSRVGLAEWNSNENDDCLVYSFGIGGKFGFESDLIRLTKESRTECEVHLFDPRAKKWSDRQPKLPNLHVHAFGLASEGQETDTFRSYTSFLKQFGHTGRTVNLLKLDIERAEVNILPQIAQLPKRMRPQQILVEIHWKNTAKEYEVMDNVIVQLRDAGYVMFHTEHNFFASMCTEFSFLLLSSRTLDGIA